MTEFDASKYNFVPIHDDSAPDVLTINTNLLDLSDSESPATHEAVAYARGVIIGKFWATNYYELLEKVKDVLIARHLEDGLRETIKTRCAQPGCTELWIWLVHPKRALDELGREFLQGYFPNDVRGFCADHYLRGERTIEDCDDNYVPVGRMVDLPGHGWTFIESLKEDK